MKRIELTTANKPLSEYAKEFDDEVIVLTSHHKPVAAIISLKDIDAETAALSTNPEFMRIIERARAEIAQGKSLSLEELEQQIQEK